MCDKCAELDGKIRHYQRMAIYIADQLTLDGIKTLNEEMNARKMVLHPTPKA